MINEKWVEVKGYEGYYEVSNLGRVRSVERTVFFSNGCVRVFKGQVLKPTKDPSDYLKVHFARDGAKKMVRLHKLFAEHFINNPNGYDVVNFIDRDKNNLDLSNLVWVTQQVSNQRGADKNKAKAKVRKGEAV